MPSIFLTNLRSVKNKFDELCSQMCVLNTDIAICTETWLSSRDPLDAYGINGYDCHRVDRSSDSGHGGVAIWTKNMLRTRKLPFLSFDFLEICAVQIPLSKLIIIGIYLPPGIVISLFRFFCEAFIKAVDEVLNQLPLHRLVVAGDFNQYDRSFLSSNLSLCNIVTGPTRISANLDLIFVDKSMCTSYVPENVVIGPPIGTSDHRSVFAPGENATRDCEFQKHFLFDLRLSNIFAFEQRFLSHDLKAFYSCKDIEKACQMFYDFVNSALSVIPQHVVFLTNNDAPWMTPLIKFLIQARWKAYRSRNWPVFNNLKSKVNREIWRAKKAFFLRKSKSVKGLWSYVNMERGSSKRDCSTLVGPSTFLSDILGALNDHFCGVMHSQTDLLSFTELPDDSWFPPFSVVDVWQNLYHLPCKATGSDGIPTKLYKRAALILAEPVHFLISECIRQRRFPSAWKIADVVPVPKGKGTSIEDFRPISLLPIPAKLCEKFILRSMKKQFSNLLGDNQFGVRKNSSTTHAIIATHDAMTKHADDPEVGASIFITFDFSKAFDRIDHQRLVHKAQDMKLPTGFLRLLTDYLRHRKQRVRVNGQKSDLKGVTSGVPQGSLLGPYLFGIFLASLQPINSSIMMVKYVDDISLVAPLRQKDALKDLERIQSEISNIFSWSSTNNLTLNPAKTSGLIYSRGSFKETFNIKSILKDVQFKSSVRFLGVVLDANLRWKNHVNFVAKKCSQRMYILRRVKSVTTNDEFFMIYCGLIRSLIEYACPAFIGLSSSDVNRLQAIQKRCLKIKGLFDAPDLFSRRKTLALALFNSLQSADTFMKHLCPSFLPSGRLSIPFCRTSLRRSSFFPFMCIDSSSEIHLD
jgi:hypothetical protein